MKKITVLAIDLGAESGRVMAVHFDGNFLQIEELHRFPNIPVMLNGTLHWNILQLWQDILTGVEKGKKYQPASLGVDTWGVDFALLDEKGDLLGIPVHYRDTRTDGMMEKTFASVPKADVFQKTGIQFLPINTIYQLKSLVERNSVQLSAAKTFLTIPDLLNYWFTGNKVCEFSNATTTQLYNPIAKDWDYELITALGIPKEIFPKIVLPGTQIGEFDGIPVIAPACHDTGSAVASVPAKTPDFAYISSGTWSLVGIESDEPVINERALHANITNEGGVNNTFRLLKNVSGLWIVQQCRKTWQKKGKPYSYAELIELAAQAGPLTSVINLNDKRLMTPGDHPEIIRILCRESGQPVPESEGEIIRCALESLALAYREVLEQVQSIASRPIDVLHIVGGGTQNKLLNQMTANATGLPVHAGPVEATVIGNAMIQLISLGEIKNLAEGRQLISQSDEIERYQPMEQADWEAAYRRYQAL